MKVPDVFLILLLTCITAHSCQILLLEYFRKQLPRRLKQHENIWYLPATSICLSVAVVVASALTKPNTTTQCLQDVEVNADIGGIGVLLGLFLPTVVIGMVLLSGHWKAEPSGAKELCMAHMANLLYLTVNLLKSHHEISIRDTLVACSSIDAISASISMAISDKDVLAARKLVMAGLILQVTAFVSQGFTLSRLSRFPAHCITELHHPTISSSKGLMWSYFVLRVLSTFSLIPTVRRLMNRLNEIEHAPRQGLQVKEARSWESLPATLFTNYLCFGALAFIQLVPTLSITRASFPQSAEKLRTEWGQSAALIVASVAIAHVGFSFFTLFRSDAMKHRLAVCEAMRTSVTWALPQRSWKTSTVGNVLQQRSPFSKVILRPSDELLVDDTQLRPYAELNLSKEEQDGLWEELKLAFVENDKVYIMDCLNRGAPDNRLDEETREYPIHMAARFGNLDVLSRIHPPGPHNTLTATDQFDIEMRNILRISTDYFDRLLSPNVYEETPLTLAVNVNQKSAVQWILDRFREIPGTSVELYERAEWEVIRVMESLIQAEKTDLLTIFMHKCPHWESTKFRINQWHCGAIDFALLSLKPRSAELIMSKWRQPYLLPDHLYNKTLWKRLEVLPETTSKKWFKLFRDNSPDAPSEIQFRDDLLREGHTELLVNFGYDGQSLCKAMLPSPREYNSARFMAGYPRDALASLPTETLDCMRTRTVEALERWSAAGARN
ncbi:hypothetical protein C7974DRAFT_43360 [Boeremia exigua]|uniref:uncharacterized protein n=1 Tax=Boeremia exigua TaxID=749465 RepID=UPI001E8EC235|nr:uncharacterized protein C7974DRAFT_43360 [Boeremia exigua]KAH6616348.1 hypothetical protein C7974DRAFT_43360 [Boeremia exigua]